MAFGREQSPRMLESVVVLFSHVQERELVAHHAEVNPLPAQLRALGRDGLRSLESSRRVDGEPFVFHNLRENLVPADVSICFFQLCFPTRLFFAKAYCSLAQPLAKLRFRARPFRGLARVLLFLRLSQHGSVFFRVCLDPCLRALLQRAQLLVFSEIVVLRFCLFCVFLDCFLPTRQSFRKPMRIVCESILVLRLRNSKPLAALPPTNSVPLNGEQHSKQLCSQH